MDTDVLVIGAGPVGLTIASELARYGVSARIVDEAAGPKDISKAMILHVRTQEVFDAMGALPAAKQRSVPLRKAAMEQFTRHAARELGSLHLLVNTVSPGGVDTDVFREHAPEAQRRAADASPLGRRGTPMDVADVVAFLASDEARWINGQNIFVDGGAL